MTCSVRGDLGPACNAAGMIDRYVLGIDHLYQKPAYRNLKVFYCKDNDSWFVVRNYVVDRCLCSVCNAIIRIQECGLSKGGQVSESSPSWCYAPFEPEGILR